MRRLTSLLLSCCVFFLTLTSCGSGDGGTSTQPSDVESPGETGGATSGQNGEASLGETGSQTKDTPRTQFAIADKLFDIMPDPGFVNGLGGWVIEGDVILNDTQSRNYSDSNCLRFFGNGQAFFHFILIILGA